MLQFVNLLNATSMLIPCLDPLIPQVWVDVLSPGEVSGTRNLSFNDPNNEMFTVTLNIVGNLARSSSSAGSSPQARRAARRSSDTSSASAASNAGLGSVTSLVFQITYNPLLNTVTIQQVSP
jgi:hypothetical protein